MAIDKHDLTLLKRGKISDDITSLITKGKVLSAYENIKAKRDKEQKTPHFLPPGDSR